METEKSTDNAQSMPVNPAALFLGMGWTRSFAEAPMKAYAAVSKEMLGATARQLEACTDYVKKLAECDDPAKSIACWNQFVRQSMASSFEEGQHVIEAFQKGLSSAAAAK